MIGFLITLHVLIAVLLIIIILLQQSSGGGLGGVFGGSQSVFGGKGAQPFLIKVTAILGTLFMITSSTIAFTIAHRRKTIERPPVPIEQTAPMQTPQQGLPTSGGAQKQSEEKLPGTGKELPQQGQKSQPEKVPQLPIGGGK